MNILIVHQTLTLISVLVYIKKVKSVNDDVLNLASDPSDYMLMRFNEGSGAYTVSSYLTNYRSRIRKIMDGSSTVWESKSSKDHLSLLKVYKLYGKNKLAYVYSLGHLIRYTRYFENRGYDWFEIPESYFDYKLEKLRKERMFDLKADNDDGTFFIQDHTLYGLKSTVFIPYHLYDVVLVCDDFDIIWERINDSDKCTCIIVHGDLENAQLIHLHLKIENTYQQMFMRKFDEDWKQIDKKQFYQYLNHLDDQKYIEQIHDNDL